MASVEDLMIRMLVFDVACRASGEFQRISACYHIVPEVSVAESPQRLHYRSRDRQWSVAARNIDSLRNANQTLRMDMFGAGELPLARTVQWQYVIHPMDGPFAALFEGAAV